MKISLCMIVKDEESTLSKCLSSAKKFVNEIVILDTGSTDKTVKIAKGYGAKIHHFEWCNDFSAARNEALKHVTGDWVLILDADETLAPEMIPTIREAVQTEEYLLINLVREEIGARQSPYSMVSRLFRNHPDIHFSRPYHALVDDSVSEILVKEPHWQIGYIQGIAILHSGYQQSEISNKNKLERAKVGMEEFFANNPDDAYICSKLGALYIDLGKITESIQLLSKGVSVESENSDILYELYYHLGIAYSRLKNYQQAIAHYQAATKLPIYPILKLGAYNNLGSLLKEKGDLNGAKKAYETTLKIDPSFISGYYNLGMTYKAMGLFKDAIAAYVKAIDLNPNYAQAYQNLGVVLLKAGYVDDSLTAFKEAIDLHVKQNNHFAAEQLRKGLKDMGLEVKS
ncbi:glycosyl transferase [Rivularia sp. PCC 7116]|uniref:tetratricopeptide repeat protein n=1 Tax=Rivularia sp. PCC 7116 TaxID=373994 RepID=UPI00029F0EE6|nr:glycosyl transferase [Rivularia sp. PCC 7116]